MDDLKTLTPGKIPLEYFNEIARLTVVPVIELVLLHQISQGAPMVFLCKRNAQDSYWPNLYHVPGQILSSHHSSIEEGLSLLKENKLMDIVYGQPTFVTPLLVRTRRGKELALIYSAMIQSIQVTSSLFPIDQLPDMIEEHDHMVQLACHKMNLD